MTFPDYLDEQIQSLGFEYYNKKIGAEDMLDLDDDFKKFALEAYDNSIQAYEAKQESL